MLLFKCNDICFMTLCQTALDYSCHKTSKTSETYLKNILEPQGLLVTPTGQMVTLRSWIMALACRCTWSFISGNLVFINFYKHPSFTGHSRVYWQL